MVSRYEVLAGSEGKAMIREIWMVLKRWWTMPTVNLDKIDALDLTDNQVKLGVQIAKTRKVMADNPDFPIPVEFAVTSKPRHIPWSRRKKELEAAARQKRRQVEEFREPQWGDK